MPTTFRQYSIFYKRVKQIIHIENVNNTFTELT